MNVQEEILEAKIDPHLSDVNLGVLLERAFGEKVEIHGHRVLTGGCWNRVIGVALSRTGSPDVSDQMVCKISPELGDARLVREYDVLNYFDSKTDMPVPKPLLIDVTGNPIPGTALIMTMIPGTVLHESYGYLDNAGRAAISEQVAEYVTQLHRCTEPGFGGIELPSDKRDTTWAEFWLPRFDDVLDEVRDGDFVSEAMLEQIGEIRTRFAPALDIGPAGTLTHYDIWSGNVMVDVRSQPAKVTGFIDIPGFYADYAREISFMLMFGMADETFFTRYASVHTFDSGFENRINMYNLKMHLKHITMYPHESHYREGARRCLEHLQTNLK